MAPLPELTSIHALIKQWPLVTRKLLVIRPDLPGDSFTAKFTIPASTALIGAAKSLLWDVHDLKGNDTSRTKVENAIKSFSPDFIVHYDHGSSGSLNGQDANQKVSALDASNTALLKGHAVSTVSCYSAAGFGVDAIGKGARAYLGYSVYVYVYYKWVSKYIDAANAANVALLEGKTFDQAWQIGYDRYTKHYNELLLVDTVAAGTMLASRDGLKRLGDKRVVARPIGILVVE